MSYAFRVHPITRQRPRRLTVAILIAVALLIAAAARFVWRKLRPPPRDSNDHAPPDVTVPITITRLCARTGCANPLPAGASGRALYCSPACRQATYRERRAVA